MNGYKSAYWGSAFSTNCKGSGLVFCSFLKGRCRIDHEVVDTLVVPLSGDASESTHRLCRLHNGTQAS
jgi:hypothetical protein